MKKRLLLSVVLVLCICICFSGCSFTILSANDLIRPPKLSGESSFLQQAFEKTVSNEFIQMKTPIKGENRSSYIIFDIDADGYDDGLVFYSDPSVDDFARVAVFKHDGNEWKNVSNLVGIAEEIYEVGFNDINGDGKFEVLISWTTLNPDSSSNETLTLVGNRTLTLYKFGGSGMTLLKTDYFTKMLVADFNKDGADDIFLSTVNISDDVNKTIGRIITFDKDCSVSFNKTVVLTGMLDVVSIACDSVSVDGRLYTRIYVDGNLSEAAYVTDIVQLSVDNNDVSLPLHYNLEFPTTARSSKVFSCDVDRDGIIEVPTLRELPFSKSINDSEDNSSPLNLVVWSQLGSEGLTAEFNSLYNKANNYYFIFKDEWISNITAVYNANSSLLVFYSVENGVIADKLFSVTTFSGAEWSDNKYDFDMHLESGTYIYGYKYEPNEYISVQEIRDNFVVLS